jgi:DNA primase
MVKNDKVGKYVNSPTSLIYEKHNELFGLYQAKQSIAKNNSCYLVEGQMDVIQLVQSGIENVVASGGTALTTNQIRLLHRFTENITLLYDGDKAGIKAALRGIDMMLEEGLNVRVILLP